MNVFNPLRVFSEHWKSSWCDNLEGSDDFHVPISTDRFPELVFRTNENYGIVVLPVVRDWSTVNISEMQSIKFQVSVCGHVPHFVVSVISVHELDGEEYESPEVRLDRQGLNLGDQEFEISVSEFDSRRTPNLTEARALKFTSYGPCDVKLSRVIIV